MQDARFEGTRLRPRHREPNSEAAVGAAGAADAAAPAAAARAEASLS